MSRPGTTLLELLIFLAFFAICSTVLVTFFFTTSEQRIRQQVVSSVQQSGLQITQSLTHRIRSAEQVLDPVLGESGSILALQIADEAQHPTIITIQSGAIMVVEQDTLQQLSSEQVTISDFAVYNTSAVQGRESVIINFTVSRPLVLGQVASYQRPFTVSVSLFPDDQPEDHCGCTTPQCSDGVYTWQYCEAETCIDAETVIICSE